MYVYIQYMSYEQILYILNTEHTVNMREWNHYVLR